MITVNLYYSGVNRNARKFAEEMESSGTADKIRAEKGNYKKVRLLCKRRFILWQKY